MSRYILRSTGKQNTSLNEVKSSLKAAKGQIIDDSAFPRMLVVETQSDLLKTADSRFKDEWNIFPERKYGIPDTKVKIKK